MPLTATAIGAFPKPDYVKLPDWFADMGASNPTVGWSEALAKMGDEAQGIIKRGVGEAVCAQVAAGVDIPTDGEIARENYIHYHCRHLVGVDFEKRTEKKARIGNYCALLPTVCGAVSPRELFLADDWRCAQQATDKPVKITMPGPLTLAGTVVDEFYGDLESLGKAIAAALNAEVISLAKAGCKHIQIDEPLFARQPQNAVAFGVENLERAFSRLPVIGYVHRSCLLWLSRSLGCKRLSESARGILLSNCRCLGRLRHYGNFIGRRTPPQRFNIAGAIQNRHRYIGRCRHRAKSGGKCRRNPPTP